MEGVLEIECRILFRQKINKEIIYSTHDILFLWFIACFKWTEEFDETAVGYGAGPQVSVLQADS